ncbi:LptA/OstA family protein [Endozoicomonas arenosclerae]|uniref:LptA/OstA family protein n=1 Tax=Endozoicomonas arenosclerae TaxID=1633495 RepID=UPI000785F051|nr:LptA/OstA family protein [Endozoicomonas arenosclerae]
MEFLNTLKKGLLLSVFLAAPATASEKVSVTTGSGSIYSNSSTVDLKNRQRTFTGDVEVITQDFVLNSDQLDEFNFGTDISELVATGKLVNFIQLKPYKIQISHGTAEKMIYKKKEKLLLMWNFEVYDLDGNISRGKKATYFLK